MHPISASIIGLGKVGTLIQLLLQKSGHRADWTFITTPDGAIHETAVKLAENDTNWEGRSVIHCSGALPASVLQPLADQGVLIASCHPMLSVVNSQVAAEQFAGTLCTLEGDEALCSELSTWLHSLGALTSRITAEQKPLYHAACSLAANYWVTLAAVAQDCLQQAGLDPAVLHQGILRLQQSVIDNLAHQPDFMRALTGPIARGDMATVELHREALKSVGYDELYNQLAVVTKQWITASR